MNCKWCNKRLSDAQVYSFLRGKSKGDACCPKHSMLIFHYETPEKLKEKTKSICSVCGCEFNRNIPANGVVCSKKCQGVLSSARMKANNPMKYEEYRIKASKKHKEINSKPIIHGGNGRGATIQQLTLYNELTKVDDSFQMELIEKTGDLRFQFNSPRHYKIDIASRVHMLAIEVDGSSHNSLKVKECDKRKTELLSLKGWRVLRLSNYQIDSELENCVRMVLSMI